MNKILLTLVLLLVAWLAKLTFDVYTLENQQLKQLESTINQQVQRLGNLNDQLIALQHNEKVISTQSKHVENPVSSSPQFTVQDYIVGQLQLTQSALQQQQYSLALEQIQSLRQLIIEKKILSESLSLALLEALTRDQNSINQYIQQRSEHLQILQQQLNKIELAMVPKPLDPVEKKWRWSAWFSFNKADDIPDFENRALHYKHIQLQLLIARQALYAGQNAFYQTQIIQIVKQLSSYPDQTSRNMMGQLQKISTFALSAPPKLSALALVEE